MVTNRLQSKAATSWQFRKQEETVIKRAITLILSVMVLAGLFAVPTRANAATADAMAGIVTTEGKVLNVRAGASTGTKVITSLKNGSYVTLLSRTGDWWQVEYAQGRYGYCHGDYITKTSGSSATVQTKSTALNVRSGPGTSYSRVAALPKGEGVIVLSSSGGWSRILYHGTKTGYVSTQYLSEASSGAITLDVPSYKQNDSRWASTVIGTSGKTIAQIGCATTAIAMMESYRTGTVIYPDAMAKSLRYTPSGSVYWPSHYQVNTSSGYLEAIYRQLQQGKPVLFGAKNSYGKQHWVVITGFTGGDDLKASDFTILDPGSSTRTTLQQFLGAYPVFYKYFCY